jgi:hypothetical protein
MAAHVNFHVRRVTGMFERELEVQDLLFLRDKKILSTGIIEKREKQRTRETQALSLCLTSSRHHSHSSHKSTIDPTTTNNHGEDVTHVLRILHAIQHTERLSFLCMQDKGPISN